MSNVALALIVFLLLTFAVAPSHQAMVDPTGFSFGTYVADDLPAAKSGLPTDVTVTAINGKSTVDFLTFADNLKEFKPGDTVNLNTNKGEYSLTLAEHPDDSSKPYLGINNIKNDFSLKEKYNQGAWKYTYFGLETIGEFFRWLFILSLGIGLFNLLPLPIVDGGQMTQIFLTRLKGEKVGNKRYHQISALFLLLLVFSLVFPFVYGLT